MLLDMRPDTTIKVTRELRERISAAARGDSATVNQFLSGLMDEHDRNRRMAAAAEAMRSASPEVLEAYRRELRAWDVTDADGLENA